MTSPFSGQAGQQAIPTPESTEELHKVADTDSSTRAVHHTLGIQPNQAAPGDHIHDGRTSKTLAALTPKVLTGTATANSVGYSNPVGELIPGWGRLTTGGTVTFSASFARIDSVEVRFNGFAPAGEDDQYYFGIQIGIVTPTLTGFTWDLKVPFPTGMTFTLPTINWRAEGA